MITSNINLATEILSNNEIIGLPTETVYGLAGNAYSEVAIKKIFALKQRPLFNPLIVHIKSSDYLEQVAIEVPDLAYALAQKFWPGPLTLILKKQNHIPDIVTAGKETVAVRMPNHPVALALLAQLPFPLAAPSANPFGSISPTTAEHVFNYFPKTLSCILQGGSCHMGVESTIIGFDQNRPILYRHGSIAIEEIEKIVGEIEIITSNENSPNAPGMLSRHYAPKTEIVLTNNIQEELKNHTKKKIGIISLNTFYENEQVKRHEILSETGSLHEATQNLYAAMHRMDEIDLDIIIAERMPEIGLGKTINDRLTRATKK